MARPIEANPISVRPIQANPIGSVGPLYPAILSEAIFWGDGSTIVDNGVNVTGFTNKGTGGSAYDFNGVNGINDLVKDTILGVTYIHGSGASGLTLSSPINIPQPFTIMCFAFVDNIDSPQFIYASDGNTDVSLNYADALGGYRSFAGAGRTIVTDNLGPLVFGVITNGASGRYEIKNIENQDPVNNGANSYDFSNLLSNGSAALFSESAVGGLIVWDRALTTTEFDDAMNYLESIITPTIYNIAMYGDSQIDPSSTDTVDPISWGLNIFTQVNLTNNNFAVGGNSLSQVRASFDANKFPAGTNTDLFNGAQNDVINDRDLALMQDDVTYMLEQSFAAGRQVFFVGPNPMGTANANYTVARGQKLIDFNNWGLATYGHHWIDIYTATEDQGNPEDLAIQFQKNATDAHLSDNGCREVDNLIANKLYTRPYSRAVNAGNIHPFPIDFTQWGYVDCTMAGGPNIRLADGTYSTDKGVLATNTNLSVKQVREPVPPGPSDANVTVSVLVRPGQFKWVRLEYRDNSNAINIRYVNVLDLTIGGGGTANWTVTKAAYGWVKCELITVSANGTSNNNINLRPALADGSNAVTAINTSQPLMYFDVAQIHPT